jgi:hypothetical protein
MILACNSNNRSRNRRKARRDWVVAGVEEGTMIADVRVEEPDKLRLMITGVLRAESLVLLLLCFSIAFAPFSETKLSTAQRISHFRGGVLGFRPGRATSCLAVQLGGGPQGRTLLQLRVAKIKGPWGKNAGKVKNNLWEMRFL